MGGNFSNDPSKHNSPLPSTIKETEEMHPSGYDEGMGHRDRGNWREDDKDGMGKSG